MPAIKQLQQFRIRFEMRKKIVFLLSLMQALIIVCLAFVSCSEFDGVLPQKKEKSSDNLVINSITFDPSYKTAVMRATALEDYGNHFVVDSCFRGLEIYESSKFVNVIHERLDLDAVGVRDLTTERFDSLGIKILVLADLTLPQKDIDKEREAVGNIRANLHNDNLYISFLKSDGVITDTELVTDYIMENCFEEDINGIDKHLYAGILSKMQEIHSRPDIFGTEGQVVLLAMSDGCVWGTDQPLDPDHFEVQEELNRYCRDSSLSAPIYYSNFGNLEMGDFLAASKNNEILTLCKTTGGLYQDKFRWLDFCNAVSKAFGLPDETFEINMVNPDGRIYTGEVLTMRVEMRSPLDSLILSGEINYSVSEYGSVIVNGASTAAILFNGMLIWIVLMLVTFIAFQYIEPWIRYKIFQKKYVTRYKGPNMSMNGILVAEECYLCKAPFKAGDEIVAKCEHTMHKQCWDENEYHCPEYLGHCTHGAHYYNSENRSDLKNARYFAKWLYVGLLAAFFGWVLAQLSSTNAFDFRVHQSFIKTLDTILTQPLPSQTLSDSTLASWASKIYACAALLIGLMVVQHKQWGKRLAEIFVRALLVAACTFYTMEAAVLSFSFIESASIGILVSFVAFSTATLLFVAIMSFRTPVKPRKKVIAACLAFLFIHILVWNSVLTSYLIDYRIIQLYFYMGYTVLLSIGIATFAPRSNRYVLHTEGCLKTTDIALYKWFRANPEMIVTIGKSVDCNIQMSWDIKGDIAPLQASIFMKNSACYLKAEEGGVTLANGKPLKEGKSVKLYHSTSFTIGTTKYTYTEMDTYHGF